MIATKDLLVLHVLEGVVAFRARIPRDAEDDEEDGWPSSDDDDDDDDYQGGIVARIDGVAHALWSDGISILISRDDHPRPSTPSWPFSDPGIVLGAAADVEIGDAPLVCNLVVRPSVIDDEAIDGKVKETDDMLCAIDERTGLLVLEVGVEWRDAPPMRSRQVMPLSSGVNILPNTRAQIMIRPQRSPFRPERMIIGGTPADWVVNDIRCGNRSQFSHRGDVPGELFSTSSIESFLMLEVLSAAMDFVVVVTYVGNEPAGAPFVGAVVGDGPDQGPRRVRSVISRWTPGGRMRGWMRGDTGAAALALVDPGSALVGVV